MSLCSSPALDVLPRLALAPAPAPALSHPRPPLVCPWRPLRSDVCLACISICAQIPPNLQTWKKRWFVLRPAHLAFYKTSAEYKLLRLLDLSDIHSCTQVVLKKHTNTFGLVSPTRTFYLQAERADEVRDWVAAINDARHALLSTSTRNSVSSPIPIPTTPSAPHHAPRISSSPSQSPNLHQLTSSDSEDASPNTKPQVVSPPPSGAGDASSPSKPVLSGYLMKCGSRRHNWHKRWFVLSGEKLIYSRSHMVRAWYSRDFGFAD